MLRHFRFPIGEPSPRFRLPHFLRRWKQGTGIGDGSATDCTAMQDRHMTEEPHIEEATKAQFGAPEPTADRPTGPWQRVRRPSPAHFHYRNPVAFLHQAMGRNAAPEAGTDHDEIEIELVTGVRH